MMVVIAGREEEMVEVEVMITELGRYDVGV